MIPSVRCLAVAAVALFAAGPALADSAAPKPAAAPEKNCIADAGGFKTEGRRHFYEVALENKCEQRVKCIVYISVSTARGDARGHRTLLLAGKAAGERAKKSYRLSVKEAGGMAQVSRECKMVGKER